MLLLSHFFSNMNYGSKAAIPVGPWSEAHPRLGEAVPCRTQASGPGSPAALLAVTKSAMLWVSLEGEISQKPAYCWPVPREGSRPKCDLCPSGRAGRAAAWLCAVPTLPRKLCRMDFFPSEGELSGRERAKGRWLSSALGRKAGEARGRDGIRVPDQTWQPWIPGLGCWG